MPRTVDHAERREALLEATIGLVRRGGVGAVTVRGVAEAIGRSTASVTHYVRDRRELLQAAVSWVLEDRRRILSEAARGPEPLRAVLLRSIEADDAALWGALLVAAADREPDLAPILVEFDTWWTEVVRSLVTAGGVEDPHIVADVLGAVVDGLLLTVDVEEWDDDRRVAVIDRSLSALAAAPETGRVVR